MRAIFLTSTMTATTAALVYTLGMAHDASSQIVNAFTSLSTLFTGL